MRFIITEPSSTLCASLYAYILDIIFYAFPEHFFLNFVLIFGILITGEILYKKLKRFTDANADHLGGVDQKLYHGSSLEQLDGLVDLLMNYPTYAKNQSSVSTLVQSASSGQAGAAEATDAGEGDDDDDSQ